MKKRVILGLAAALFALVLTAQIYASGSSEATTATAKVRTIKILGNVDQGYWDSLEKQAVWKAFKEYLAKEGLDLQVEAIPNEQYATVLQTRLATGTDIPDLVNIGPLDDATVANLGKTGMFLDAIPLVEKYSNGNIKKAQGKYFPAYWGPAITTEGKAFWMPGWSMWTVSGKPGYSLMVPLIRYDWLQKLGLPMPKTMAELSADLKAFRNKDVNGSGKPDEVMLFNPSFEYFGPQFGLPKSNIALDITDDRIKSPWLMKEKLATYIKWYQDMVTSGVLDTDAFDKPYEYQANKIKTNMVGLQTGFALTGYYDTNVTDFKGVYMGVVAPQNPSDFYVYGAPPLSVGSKIAITKNAKDLQAVIAFFDACHTDQYAIWQRFGVEGVSHTVVNGMVMPVDGLSNRDFDLSGKACLAALAGGVTPTFRIESFEQFANNLSTDKALADMRKQLAFTYSGGFKNVYVWGEYQRAAMPDADAKRKAALSTDLNTYMNETLTKLVLGQYKVEDLDTYIAKMKSLGLEELISIEQKSHDRFIGKK